MISMTNFELEYEMRLQRVKAQFLACKQWELVCFEQDRSGALEQDAAACQLSRLQQDYANHLRDLRAWVRANFSQFDPAKVSSLMALPTQVLSAQEKVMHRIWLGGALPALAQEAIRQWGCALDEVATSTRWPQDSSYQLVLWVWDSQQLHGEPGFGADATEGRDQPYHIGSYRLGTQVLQVHSLRSLAASCFAQNLDLLEHLHTRRYYVNLSDVFRLLILREFGGIYLDADTMPYRPATLFLAKPEVPDFVTYQCDQRDQRAQTIRPCHISWMNLFQDENGMLVAKKGNPALAALCARIKQNLSKMRFFEKENEENSHASPRSQSYAQALYASTLHDATYGVWQQAIGHTFLSHHELMRSHCVLADDRQEAVIAGLQGMRLVVDAISNQKVALDAFEQAAYQHLLAAMEQRAGRWDDILELEQVAQVFALDEVPRMAYPPQLRARIAHCHYYSFLSEDSTLDQANTLFARYLLKKNALRIQAGDYWCQAGAAMSSPMREQLAAPKLRAIQLGLHMAKPAMHFVPGAQLAEPIKDRMAKLLFATSYLEYCSANNKLRLPLVALQRRQNIDPYLEWTWAMFDHGRNFIGFFCAATMEEFSGVQAVSHYRDEIKPMDDAYDAFVAANTQVGDLFVSSLALDEAYKGRGLFHALFGEIILLARRKQCRHVSLAVWGRSAAFQVYVKQGFKVRGVFDDAWDKFFDRLYLMAYEVAAVSPHEHEHEQEQEHAHEHQAHLEQAPRGQRLLAC